MKIADLNGKNICILGFGKEGQAILRALEKHAPDAEITIADQNEKIEKSSVQHWFQIGNGWLENLHKFDVIIKSPGIPPNPTIETVKEKVTSGTQIFLDSIADSGATVIGVTGSKGKSTTASLIYEILKAAKKDVHLIGNIGNPAIDFIDKAKPGTAFVMEMSSYQLMNLTVSPQIAVITSFFPEHLDYHGSLESYFEAKSHIAQFQTHDDVIFYNASFAEAKKIAEMSAGKKVPFSADDSPIPIEQTQLIGQHNQSNIAAAFKVARHLGISKEICIDVFRTFKGLPHRLQSLGTHHDIEWIDDAISTTPESTIAALDALKDRVQTIILGGQDRGNDFSELGKRIMASKIETVILFPGSGPRIREAIEKADTDQRIKFFEADDMTTAVQIAIKETTNRKLKTKNLPICLLSTASPSYGMFKNFEEKGDRFREEILHKN